MIGTDTPDLLRAGRTTSRTGSWRTYSRPTSPSTTHANDFEDGIMEDILEAYASVDYAHLP
jgi:hypothetical protein